MKNTHFWNPSLLSPCEARRADVQHVSNVCGGFHGWLGDRRALRSALSVALVLWPLALNAHDHVEVVRDPGNPARLAVEGNLDQIATFFPSGEAPSFALSGFPGGAFANELTFSAFENTSPPPGGATVSAEVLHVAGPQGGSISFRDNGGSTLAWTLPAGWEATPSDSAHILISEPGSGGYGHIHGRVFSMNRAGEYEVTFRVVDTTGNYASSLPFVIKFTAIVPPPLSIAMQDGAVRLSFTGRAGLNYDVQSTITLASDDWETIGDPLEGDGSALEFSDPVNGRERAFYRLVEYQ